MKDGSSLDIPYCYAEWDTYSRGRVACNPWKNKPVFTVYSGESCNDGICNNGDFVRMVKNEYNLQNNAVWEYSAHYDRSQIMTSYNIDGTEVD